MDELEDHKYDTGKLFHAGIRLLAVIIALASFAVFIFARTACAQGIERMEIIRPGRIATIIITPKTDSIALRFSDRSGEKNGIKIIVYPMVFNWRILQDSLFIVGNAKEFDDSTLFCNMKTGRCGDKIITLRFRDFNAIERTNSFGKAFVLRIEIDKNADSIFYDRKISGAYIEIVGNWREYNRIRE